LSFGAFCQCQCHYGTANNQEPCPMCWTNHPSIFPNYPPDYPATDVNITTNIQDLQFSQIIALLKEIRDLLKGDKTDEHKIL